MNRETSIEQLKATQEALAKLVALLQPARQTSRRPPLSGSKALPTGPRATEQGICDSGSITLLLSSLLKVIVPAACSSEKSPYEFFTEADTLGIRGTTYSAFLYGEKVVSDVEPLESVDALDGTISKLISDCTKDLHRHVDWKAIQDGSGERTIQGFAAYATQQNV